MDPAETQKVVRLRHDGGSFLLAGDPLAGSEARLDGGALPALLGAGWKIASVHPLPAAGSQPEPVAALVILERRPLAGKLWPKEISAEEGACFKAHLGDGLGGDDNDRPRISRLRLFEDDRELGPPHTAHATIRADGDGRFSHWGAYLYFSSSDRSDPRHNRRTYTWRIDS